MCDLLVVRCSNIFCCSAPFMASALQKYLRSEYSHSVHGGVSGGGGGGLHPRTRGVAPRPRLLVHRLLKPPFTPSAGSAPVRARAWGSMRRLQRRRWALKWSCPYVAASCSVPWSTIAGLRSFQSTRCPPEPCAPASTHSRSNGLNWVARGADGMVHS